LHPSANAYEWRTTLPVGLTHDTVRNAIATNFEINLDKTFSLRFDFWSNKQTYTLQWLFSTKT